MGKKKKKVVYSASDQVTDVDSEGKNTVTVACMLAVVNHTVITLVFCI